MRLLASNIVEFENKFKESEKKRRNLEKEMAVKAQEISTMYDVLLKKDDERMKSLKLMQIIINSIAIPIFWKDSVGAYSGCNTAFENLIGFTRDEIIGKTAYDLFDEEDAIIYTKAIYQTYKHGKYSYDIRIRDGNGEYVSGKSCMQVFKDDDDIVQGVIVILYTENIRNICGAD